MLGPRSLWFSGLMSVFNALWYMSSSAVSLMLICNDPLSTLPMVNAGFSSLCLVYKCLTSSLLFMFVSMFMIVMVYLCLGFLGCV